MKRACCVVALLGLCLVAASAASDKNKPVLFEHYLNAGSSGDIPAKVAQYYEQTKTETVCLKATSVCLPCFPPYGLGRVGEVNPVPCSEANKNDERCGLFPCCGPWSFCSPYTFTVNFACAECKHDHYYGNDKMQELTLEVNNQPRVARCIITETPASFPMSLDDKPDVLVLGTFTGTCYVNDEKDTCGHPDICGADTTLSVSGVKYLVLHAVAEGALLPITVSSCFPTSILPWVGFPLQHKSSPADAPREVPGAPRDQPNDAPWWHDHSHEVKHHHKGEDGKRFQNGNGQPNGNTHQVGPAFVFMGRVELSSRHHANKYDDGYFQYSHFFGIDWDWEGDVHGLPHLGHESLLVHFTEKEHEKYRY